MLENFSQITPDWLKRAHVYQGSVGPFGHDFRYRCAQDEAAATIHAAVYSRVCFEKATDAEQADFPWNEEGVAALRQWLQRHYESFCAKTD